MYHTLTEILNQPSSWQTTLTHAPAQWQEIEHSISIVDETHFLFIGSGTSYYLAQSTAHLFQEITGHLCTAVPSSEVFLATASIVPQKVPVVAFAISRSGTTSEILMAIEYLQKNCPNVQIVSVTCHSDHELAKSTTYCISLDHAAEQSVVMTQSFTNMLLGLQIVAARVAGRDDLRTELSSLPELLNSFLKQAEEFGEIWGRTSKFKQYIFLGLGPYYGLAAEATLKLKEMTQSPCEYYNPMEFRHGPISIVSAGTVVLSFAGRADATHVERVLHDVENLGGVTTALIPADQAMEGIPTVSVPGDVSDWARTVLYMPAFQFLAYHHAVSLGLNPDRPRNLNRVVTI